MWMWAIGQLDVSVAEPLLGTNLVFARILAVPLSGQRLRRSELIGALLLSAGVPVLSVSRSINSQAIHFGGSSYWPAAGVIRVIALPFVRAGWERAGPPPAAPSARRPGPPC